MPEITEKIEKTLTNNSFNQKKLIKTWEYITRRRQKEMVNKIMENTSESALKESIKLFETDIRE